MSSPLLKTFWRRFCIQYSHCQVVQQLRSTPLSTKALTTITSKHIVYPCVRFSD